MEGPRCERIVEFFQKHGKRPQHHEPRIQSQSAALRDEHLLAQGLYYLQRAYSDGQRTPAVLYVLEHAPTLLEDEEESPAMQSARRFIELWKGGMPRTRPSKGRGQDSKFTYDDQLKGFQFLDRRRQHYRGSKDKAGCGGACDVCQLLSDNFSGWHETSRSKRKGE